MTDRDAQIAERISRQNQIDETYFAPQWAAIDDALLKLCLACTIPKQPVILMPELRFKSLLNKLVDNLPGSGKIMIVDDSNSRFETLRDSVRKSSLNLYFSTQKVGALNYADDIFHFAITEIGLTTSIRADATFSAYRRVLQPGATLVAAAPLFGSFPAFFDIFEECFFKLYPQKCQEMMDVIKSSLSIDAFSNAVESAGLNLKSIHSTSLELTFPDVETMLFSSIVESHYLGYCLNSLDTQIDGRALLTLIVRSFHHYFQEEAITLPLKMALISAQKPVSNA